MKPLRSKLLVKMGTRKVSLLLADMRINVNKPEDEGVTPFFIACENGHREVILLLLADMRIDVNKPRNTGYTPFYIACWRSQGSGVVAPG